MPDFRGCLGLLIGIEGVWDCLLKLFLINGAVNMHPSLLRLYRGVTPVQIALQVRVRETGVSVAFTVRALEVGANNNPFSCGNIYSHFLFAGKKGKFDLGKIWTLEVIELSGCIIYAPEIWNEQQSVDDDSLKVYISQKHHAG